MRYWIWWNELVQGPFELEELTSLRVFREDLLVCLEDREDWLPAGRVADLSSAIEQLKARRSEPLVLPPPPPKRPPLIEPLQGEFFGEPAGQQSLLESEDELKGPFAYKTSDGESTNGLPAVSQVTMPFHFSRQPNTSSVVDLPRPPAAQPRVFPVRPVITESPVRMPEPVQEEIVRPEHPPAVSLKILQEDALPEVADIPVQGSREILPSLTSPYEGSLGDGRKLEWLPWIMGVVLAIAALTSVGYWLMDHASSRSAIAEANRMEPPKPLSIPVSVPVAIPAAAPMNSVTPTPEATPVPTSAPALAPAPAAAPPLTAGAKKAWNAIPKKAVVVSILKPVNPPVTFIKRIAEFMVEGRLIPFSLAIGHSLGLGHAAHTPIAATVSTVQTVNPDLAVSQIAAPAVQAPAALTLPRVKSARIAPAKTVTKAVRAASPKKASPKRAGQAAPVAAKMVKTAPKKDVPRVAPSIKIAAPNEATPAVPVPSAPVEPAPAAAAAQKARPGSEPQISRSASSALPGVALIAPLAATTPDVPAVDAPAAQAPKAADPWAKRQSEAINLVIGKTLPGSKITIGVQARTMLEQMHEKELLHAAETGERLYLPDKIAWAALQEDKSRYRVYLNFLSWQASGERVQARSYQFVVDLKTKAVRADDQSTEQDILTQPAELHFKHNPMATDIDSILGGVDTYNKHKVQLIIVKKNRANRAERTKMETAMTAAQDKVRRGVVYFRRTYTEKALQNIAQAYMFLELINGK